MSDIDFDTARFQEPLGGACVVCKNDIASTYWEVNGQLVCERCYLAHASEFDGQADAAGYLRGLALGIGAALLGAVGWVLITIFSGYQLGIVAIAVGWLVGKAVLRGTRRQGGVPGQLMAVGLTYLAIVSQYLFFEILRSEGGSHLVVAIGSALVAPFTQETRSVLGIVILGIGLYQAWQNSASVSFTVKGPFRLVKGADLAG